MKILKDRSVVVVREGESSLNYHGEVSWTVLETQPTILTVKFGVTNFPERYGCYLERPKIHHLQLALPYVVFCYFHFKKENTYRLRLGFSNKPLESDDDFLYYPLLPNVYGDMYSCEHPTSGRVPKNESWAELCSLYWMRPFNMYGPMTGSKWVATMMLCDTFLRSYENWSKISLEEGTPNFMLDFDKLYKNIRIQPSTLSKFVLPGAS